MNIWSFIVDIITRNFERYEEAIERGSHQDGHVTARFVFMVDRLYFGGIPLLLVLFPASVDTSFV